MKKILKVTLVIIVALLVIVSAVAAYVSFALPNVGDAPDLKVELTPQRVKRGKYLATSVAGCVACHSERDFRFFAGPSVPETMGGGGEKFGRETGFPGNVYAKNITPYALGNWTDGEVYRAITAGVSKDGRALFPIMPYEAYAQMDPEDIYAIIAYIRTLKPVKANYPERELDFPLNFIVNTVPAKATLKARPDTGNSVEYGKYLVTTASCIHCHTKEEKGELVKGTEFGGGQKFPLPSGTVHSRNITPDQETGIGNWTRDQFIQRFATYRDSAYRSMGLKPSDPNTIMPWISYSTMTDKDLGAIYDYLRTVKPIKNKVEAFAKQ